MGLGCVVLIWGILATFVFAVLSVALATMSYRRQRRAGEVSARALLAAAAFPFALLAYGGVAFVAYAAWCEFVRGVDPGLGDVDQVPLDGGYSLVIIDVPEQAYLDSRDGEQVGPIRRLGIAHGVIAGESADVGLFVIRVATGERSNYTDARAWRAALAHLGAQSVRLEDPSELYLHRRWGWLDVAAGLVILAIPALLVWTFRARLRRAVCPSAG